MNRLTWDKHRLEGRDQAENPFCVVVLYWVCWLLVAGVLAMLLFWRRCSSRADSKNCAARSVVRNREPLMVYNDLTTQFFTGK